MPEGVSRVVQTDGHRMNCRQRRHISTAYLAHTHRRGAVQWRMPLPPSSAETKIVTITGSELTVIKDEPLGFHVTTPVLTRASHGTTIHLPLVIHGQYTVNLTSPTPFLPQLSTLSPHLISSSAGRPAPVTSLPDSSTYP
jgi:hypothetical protein